MALAPLDQLPPGELARVGLCRRRLRLVSPGLDLLLLVLLLIHLYP